MTVTKTLGPLTPMRPESVWWSPVARHRARPVCRGRLRAAGTFISARFLLPILSKSRTDRSPCNSP